jgi:hypothetical protein
MKGTTMTKTGLKPNRSSAANAIAVGIAIAISSLSVVRAEHYSPDKKKTSFNCSSGTACLTAQSSGSSTNAIYANGVAANTIQAQTSATNGDSAVAGIATASTGRAEGIYGASNTGDGIYGITNVPNSNLGAGVYGLSSTAYGVVGEVSSDNPGYAGIVGVDDSAENGSSLLVYDSATGDGCTVDVDGDLSCAGSIIGGQFEMRQRSAGGHEVVSYPSQSASATIEDVGTAQMIGGVADVQLTSRFASVMDGKWYYVFLTPLGDARGLYVSKKATSGFQVRESEHGRDSLEFDYRVVAHPLGATADQLPPDTSLKRLAKLIHRH